MKLRVHQAKFCFLQLLCFLFAFHSISLTTEFNTLSIFCFIANNTIKIIIIEQDFWPCLSPTSLIVVVTLTSKVLLRGYTALGLTVICQSVTFYS